MGSALPKIRVVAQTAFQETLRRKVLWAAVVLMLLIVLIAASSTAVLRMATESGEVEMGDSIRSGIVASVLGVWSSAGLFLAIFLGAVGLSSETSAKTIVSVLARPIDRSSYLTGRWLGVLAFLWGFQLVGIAIALGLAFGLHAQFAPTLWLGLASLLVNSLLMSGVSLALSVVAPPILAGIAAFLLPVLTSIAEAFIKTPKWYVRGPSLVLYYLLPAKMPTNLLADSFSKSLLHPNYRLYAMVLGENFGYALAVFALACVIFARRELRLR